MKKGTIASGLTMASRVMSGLKSMLAIVRDRRSGGGAFRHPPREHPVALLVQNFVAVLVGHFPDRAHQAHIRAFAHRPRLGRTGHLGGLRPVHR
jgi:hypothetical protein